MQSLRENHLQAHIESLLPSEWRRLVRLCASISGNADAAEDLAQETMIEAWRHAGNLRDPQAITPWLSGIARNVCRRWIRRQARDAAKIDRLARSGNVSHGYAEEADPGETLSLEHDELTSLLDRAPGLLPAPTRDVLVQHYVDERPHGEIAGALGVSEGAVAVRVHRGKLALKQILARPDMSDVALACGIAQPEDAGWQATRIWCPLCGRQRLTVRIDRESGMFSARCTGACVGDGTVIGCKAMTAGAVALTSVKSVLRRELIDLHVYYRAILAAGGARCHDCGRPFGLGHWPSDESPSLSSPYARGLFLTCSACGAESSAPLSHLLLDTPLIQEFWRHHPRMQVLPVHSVEIDRRDALVSGFASVDTSATIEVVSAADTYEILAIHGPDSR